MGFIRTLGYVGFETRKLNEWKAFAENIIGLELYKELSDGTLIFRNDEYEKRLFIHPGDSEDILYNGWEVSSPDKLKDIAQHLSESGLEITRLSQEELKQRSVIDGFKVKDPEGLTQEIFYGATVLNHQPFVSKISNQNFITGEQGMGHVVLCADNYDAQIKFYKDLFGFKITDYNELKLPGIDGHITFMRCNPRHHSLAISNFKFSKKMNHIMFEVDSVEAAGLAYDRAQKSGAHILISFGQHTNDKVLSFYVVTPSGWAVEIGYGGLKIDEEVWHVTNHPKTSIWGHVFTPPQP